MKNTTYYHDKFTHVCKGFTCEIERNLLLILDGGML